MLWAMLDLVSVGTLHAYFWRLELCLAEANKDGVVFQWGADRPDMEGIR
jgi:hypothetical protein